MAWIRSLKKAIPEDQSQEMLSESPRRVVSGSAAYGTNLRWIKSKVAWGGHFFFFKSGSLIHFLLKIKKMSAPARKLQLRRI